MPRRAEITPRTVDPDPVYGSILVSQLVNKVMKDGKKGLAESIVYDALAVVGERTGKPPVEVLDQAVKTLTPVLEVRSRRVGGATSPCGSSSASPARDEIRASRICSPASTRTHSTLKAPATSARTTTT